MNDAPVLVIEDEPDLAATCQRLLAHLGYRVLCATSRGEALALIEAEPLALVISDVRLPDGTGIDCVAAAREHDTPAIVVTGFHSVAARRAAADAGAAGYLQKPFSASALASLVASSIHHSPNTRD
jgi:DNA-binding NtrC family response regulator